MTDMDRLIAAADALAVAGNRMANSIKGDYIHPGAAKAWDEALATYRAEREAITRGTPPAFATSA